ncbi:MAG: protein jag [Firmicutes bacterium]|nr:protein jag [Bacillota bacterium]
MKFSEKWGDSIDSAVELALQDLKLTRDQVKITVLEEPSRGFLGIIGNKLAKVRVEEIVPEKPVNKAEAPAAKEEPEVPAEVEKAEAPKPAKTPRYEKQVSYEGNNEILIELTGQDEDEEEQAPRRASRKSHGRNRNRNRADRPEISAKQAAEAARKAEAEYEEAGLLSERPEDLVLNEEHPAGAFLKDLFREMGLDVTVTVYTSDDCVYAEVEGPDCGTVIGKRGQTLDSVQYLTSLVVNKDQNKYIRTIIDAEGYRRKREMTLEKLASRLAEKAVRTGRSVRLEPMNPYERKVIHSVLQNYSGVTTRSEGEEPYRRVIIEPVK